MSERTPDTAKAIASGYLFKLARNKRFFSTWHRRYYVLYSDGTLYSFKNLKSSVINRTISLARKCITLRFGEEVEVDDCDSWPSNIPKSLCFSIVNSDRSYHFVCESRREFERWEASLREVVHDAQIKTGGSINPATGGTSSTEGGSAFKPGSEDVHRKSLDEQANAEMEAYDTTGTAHPYVESPSTEERDVVKAVSADDAVASAHGTENVEHQGFLATEVQEQKRKEEIHQDDENAAAPTKPESQIEPGNIEPILNEIVSSTGDEETPVDTPKRRESVVMDDATSGYDLVGPAASPSRDSDSESGEQKDRRTDDGEGGEQKDRRTDDGEGGEQKDRKTDDGEGGEQKDRRTDDGTKDADDNDMIKNSDVLGPSLISQSALLHHVDEVVHEAFNEMVATEEINTPPLADSGTPSLADNGIPSMANNSAPSLVDNGTPSLVDNGLNTLTSTTVVSSEPVALKPTSTSSEQFTAMQQRIRQFSGGLNLHVSDDPASSSARLQTHDLNLSNLNSAGSLNTEKGSLLLSQETSVPSNRTTALPMTNSPGKLSANSQLSSMPRASFDSKNEELKELLNDIMRIGHKNNEGVISVPFGDLLKNTSGETKNISAVLRSAKKLKMVNYQGEMLFHGIHNCVDIVLLQTVIPPSAATSISTPIPISTSTSTATSTSTSTSTATSPSTSTTAKKLFISNKNRSLPPPIETSEKDALPPSSPRGTDPSSPIEVVPSSPIATAPSLSWKHKRLSEPNLSSHLHNLQRDKSFPMAMNELTEEEGAPAGDTDRVAAAVQWVDKELKKLVNEIMELGTPNSEGLYTVKFGVLFEHTVDKFEALSGVLKTAKKHKVVSYPVELLFQGKHSNVDIVLLKQEIEPSSMEKYTTTKPKGIKRTDLVGVERRRTSGFGNASQLASNSKCFICSKVIYPVEFVAANEYTFHKSCFRCCQCSKVLTPSAYATINDTFYCPTHYERMFMQRGSYAALQLQPSVGGTP